MEKEQIMNIAFLLGKKFPNLSETFITSQITGLIESDHCIDIYADGLNTTSKMHPDITKYKLLEKAHYRVSIPKDYALRSAKAIKLIVDNLLKQPAKAIEIINLLSHSPQSVSEIISLRFLYEIIPFLGKSKYDIVHCHFGHNGLKCLKLRKYGVLQGKLVTTFHGADITKALQKGEQNRYKELFDKGDLFLPISENWKSKLIELGCNPNKIIVHHMGVDCDSFIFKQREVSSNQVLKLVTVSRLVEKKGIEYGIRATAELVKRNLNICYEIIGDGPLRDSLKQLISDLGMSKFIHLKGWQDKNDVINALDKSHIMLAPSVTSRDGDQEGIPVALMEAMAIGIPVVSTFHSGIPELIQDRVSGFLVPEKNVKTLADRIELLLKHPTIYSEIATEASQRVQSDFNTKKLNLVLENIFKDLLKGI